MKHVTLRQLKVFEAVARHLSFSRAAEELHLTQPAVSMQVKQLEEQAGLPLTEMVGKKVYLTGAGEEVARHARRIAQQLREAGEAIDAIKGVRGGRLSIGVISTAKYFAPRLLAEFLRRKPGIELNLRVNNRETVVRQLADNEIDLAIMGQPPQEFTTVSEAFADHPLVIVAAPDHPLAKAKHITPAELNEQAFLIREPGSGTRATMERFFADTGITPRHVLEMVGNETIKQAVMAGLGLAFISAHTVSLECEVGRLVKLPVTGTPVTRRWFVVHRADKELLPVAETFRAFLLAEAPGLMK
ncbi:MAG: LysR substrate-binding domain-containing protein [Rhodocyclaceae bacterium]|nr:LysR substrate-binding domain-containing protein [Rhodocyclaceae bacterium]MDZ4216541.1 LysR substrate-binding domain-containing protein [Rhodocyclaceae bacterium]